VTPTTIGAGTLSKNVEYWSTSKVHRQKEGSLAKRMLSQGVKDTSKKNLHLLHKFAQQCH